MFIDGIDQGYLSDPHWWFRHPEHQFRIAKLDEDYPKEYFPLAEPPRHAIENIVIHIEEYYQSITQKPLRSVFEFGTGGGWTLQKFKELTNVTVAGFEGSRAGYEACHERMPGVMIDYVDIRYPIHPPKEKYDIVICTEVAEHAELSFHGIIVHNLIQFSDLIWFSAATDSTARPHLHHPGTMPLKYWQNLFAFFGYGCRMLPDDVFLACEERGRCVFYNKRVYQL